MKSTLFFQTNAGFHLPVLHLPYLLVITGLTLGGFTSCGDPAASPKTDALNRIDSGRSPNSSPPAHAPAQTIEVAGELKQQLEAAGYIEEDISPAKPLKDTPYANVDIAGPMENIDGTFVFLDVQENIELVHNPKRARTRFSPCSTYKIPHTLIALETGVAKGPAEKIKWDASLHPKEPWWDSVLAPAGMFWDRDQTLQTAFRYSCVWYYKETAKKIGTTRMQEYLEKFQYGNKDLSGGIDTFWLNSTLEISAMEQIKFLKQLIQQKLPLKKTTYEKAFAIFHVANSNNSRLYAKSGGGPNIGWYIGFVENNGRYYLFALNMAGNFAETAVKRITLSKALLNDLGVWDSATEASIPIPK